MHEPHGYELPHSQIVTRAVTVPTIVTGRIVTIAEAEDVIASGVADLVSMVRATIADPEIVAKSLEGREDEVRPCIGCNQGCVGGLFGLAGRVGCAVNAEAGREAVLAPVGPARAPRRVLVVGAGPAGLEAARVAALRGHDVLLREAGPGPGGATTVARRAPFREEFGGICDWEARECVRLGVDMAYNTPVDRDLVGVLAPDVVIVATGSSFRRDGLQRWRPAQEVTGLEQAHVVTPVEVLTGEAAGRSALVVDDLGSYVAVGTADALLARATAVVFATSFASIAPELIPTQQAEVVLGRLHRAGVTLLTRVVLEAVTEDQANLRHLDSGLSRQVPCDLVVLVTGFEARRSLHEALDGIAADVHLVGDARSPRGLQAAIAEANGLARAL
jgi:NADPH-dependent 2,4-dienoyl-CoA reductase/sulfur reductase-like enzyme